MNPTLEVKKNDAIAVRRMVAITADSNDQLPTRLQLIKAGDWPDDSVKGRLIITTGDLYEMKANFDAGVAQSQDQNGNYIGLPIDFSHEDWKGAAIWIKALEVEGDILYASQVEYTTKGRESLLSGEYKCFSPSFYPACRGQWYDPEDASITARNVIVGGALTNIPFFKGLTAIMASRNSQEDKGQNIIYVSASNKGEIMDLATVRAKKPEELVEEEKTFLNEHKAELTADEQVAFGLQDAPAAPTNTPENPAADPNAAQNQEAAEIQASIKSGEKVLVEASAFKNLQAQVEASAKTIAGYERERITASVQKHVARGAIKADATNVWVDKIIADNGIAVMLEQLPSNPVLASEIGNDKTPTGSVALQLEDKIQEAIKASNGQLTYAQAVSKVANENSDLANQHEQEIKK